MGVNLISDSTVPQREQSALKMAENGFPNDANLILVQNSVDTKVKFVPNARAFGMKTAQRLGSLCI